MKTTIFAALLVVLFATSNAKAQQTAKPKGETVRIATSAKCGMCKKTLETGIIREPGVYSVSLELTTKYLVVQYNAKKTNPEKLRQAVRSIGYDADGQLGNQAAHDRLPECCQKTSAEHND